MVISASYPHTNFVAISDLSKRCVFCGEIPNERSREHIIPKWLIEFTGDPNRVANFGARWSQGPTNTKQVKFSFKDFQFPSCATCNSYFSDLENAAKSVIEKIFSRNEISSIELDLLLDWFDKIRIGLWLGSRTLGTTITKPLAPKFFIQQRIRRSDRALFITKLPNFIDNGLGFCGTSSAVFGLMPSVFGFRIKNLLFVNLSSAGMLLERCGFPFPVDEVYDVDGIMHVKPSFKFGHGRFQKPLIRWPYNLRSKKIFQPILGFGSAPNEVLQSPWFQKYSLGDGSMAGKILSQRGNEVILNESIDHLDFEEMKHRNFSQKTIQDWSVSVLELQNLATYNMFWGEHMTLDELHKREKMFSSVRKVNRLWMKLIKKGKMQ